MTIAGLACLLAVEGSGCGNTGGGQVTSIRIGVSVYDQYDTFISQLVEQFNQCAAEMSDSADSNISVKIEVYNAGKSQTTQNDQVKNMLELECDVFCVNLVDRTEPVTIIDMAEKQDVPVIFFNRELVVQDLERWDRLYYVGGDAKQSGTMQGEIAAEVIRADPAVDRNADGKIQYVLLEGETGHQDAIIRTDSVVKTLQEQGITLERERLGFLKKHADYIIDTSQLLTRELKQELDKIFVQNREGGSSGHFRDRWIGQCSFGYPGQFDPRDCL